MFLASDNCVKVVGKPGKYMHLAHFEDVNGDGFMDLVFQIEKESGVLSSGVVTLTGYSFDLIRGIEYFEGTDSICVVSALD